MTQKNSRSVGDRPAHSVEKGHLPLSSHGLAEKQIHGNTQNLSAQQVPFAHVAQMARLSLSHRQITPTILPEMATAEPPPEPEGPHLTDVGNADRFAARWWPQVCWCDPLGGWLIWDDKRWSKDIGEKIVTLAKEVGASIYLEARALPYGTWKLLVARWAIASESAARIASMLELSKCELPASIDQFDRDPWLLNCPNGTLDLRTGEMRSHSPGDFITKLAGVEYYPDARSDIFDGFLAEATNGDLEFANHLQRAIGYTLTGLTIEEIVFLLLGQAATGKSTLIEALLTILGDYGLKASFDSFLERRDVGCPRPDLASLRGARLVAAVETAASRTLAAPVIKELSGGDRFTARHLYHEPISFKPECKLWLAANEPPRMSDTDSGLWRRLRRIPFEHVIKRPDPKVKAHLCDPQTGAKAVFAWAVAGCLQWQRDGLGECSVVKVRTAELRAEMDPLAEFFDECCVFDRNLQVRASALREAYREWVKLNRSRDHDVVGDREWGQRLGAKGCERFQRRVDGKVTPFWGGIGLQLIGMMV